MNRSSNNPSKRGLANQRPRRAVERDVRVRAVVLDRSLRDCGLSRSEVAERIGVTPRTLAHWDRRWRTDRLGICGRGRPCRRSDRETRNAVIDLIHQAGPSIGLPALRTVFPHVAKRELVDLQRRYRRLWKKRQRRFLRRLHWQPPGTVWAMDHAEPPQPIDGTYPYLLAVRDLASHCQLAWLPVAEASSETTCAALRSLFAEYGPPLVLKSDNGSPFVAQETADLLDQAGVTHLLSPPYTPAYNGACEAGIGHLKVRTHEQAAAAGRAGAWTSDDAEAARQIGNELHRPQGAFRPTPSDAWRGRQPITSAERAAFQTVLAKQRDAARAESGYTSTEALSKATRASLDRTAIRRACVELGLLTFTGSSITPPLNT